MKKGDEDSSRPISEDANRSGKLIGEKKNMFTQIERLGRSERLYIEPNNK